MDEQKTVSFPRHGKADAREYARRGTNYLRRHGSNVILTTVHTANGWHVEVPADIAVIYPNLADLLTE